MSTEKTRSMNTKEKGQMGETRRNMWLGESNRTRHFAYAIPCGLVGTELFVLGLALGMEIKDRMYGARFDWLDIAATLLGGMVGQAVQAALVLAVLHNI